MQEGLSSFISNYFFFYLFESLLRWFLRFPYSIQKKNERVTITINIYCKKTRYYLSFDVSNNDKNINLYGFMPPAFFYPSIFPLKIKISVSQSLMQVMLFVGTTFNHCSILACFSSLIKRDIFSRQNDIFVSS